MNAPGEESAPTKPCTECGRFISLGFVGKCTRRDDYTLSGYCNGRAHFTLKDLAQFLRENGYVVERSVAATGKRKGHS